MKNCVDEGFARHWSREKLVQICLHHAGNNWHHWDVVLRRCLQNLGIRSTPDESIAIDAIPGRHKSVHLVRVFGKNDFTEFGLSVM